MYCILAKIYGILYNDISTFKDQDAYDYVHTLQLELL